MLKKIDDPKVTCKIYDFQLESGTSVFTKVLSIPGAQGKTALFIHGGGVTGNHTLSDRPSRWLIEKEKFSKVILPDRRGMGGSSPFTHKTNLKDQAADIKLLLDKLKITEEVTAIGVSYGGPISLILASMDSRIREVILIASSPKLNLTKGKLNLFYRTGIMQTFIKLVIWIFTGRSERKYVDMDFVYEVKTVPGLVKSQIKILRQMNRKNLKSLFLLVDSVFDENNMSIPDNIRLNIPVLQVIGDKDRVWENKNFSILEEHFPLFRQIIIKNAAHKDVFLRAEEFLQKIINLE